MSAKAPRPNDDPANYQTNLLYRSQIIWFGELTAEILALRNPDTQPVKFTFPEFGEISFASTRPLTNAGFESAIINVRAIFYFLGLQVSYATNKIVPRRADVQLTDVLIEDFGATAVSIAYFEKVLQEREPGVTNDDVAVCLNAADKAVAHLTRHPLDSVTIERSRATCHCANVLLKESMAKLGVDIPVAATIRRKAL
jgi:hypothetical protein